MLVKPEICERRSAWLWGDDVFGIGRTGIRIAGVIVIIIAVIVSFLLQ